MTSNNNTNQIRVKVCLEMYNGYQKPTPTKLTGLRGDPDLGKGLRKIEIKNAYLGREKTEIKGATIVNIEEAMFLQALEILVRELNTEYKAGLTIPQFLANAINNNPNLSVDASGIRAHDSDVGKYKDFSFHFSHRAPKQQDIDAAVKRDRRTIVVAAKHIEERPRNMNRELRDMHDGKPFAAVVSAADSSMMDSFYKAFEDSEFKDPNWPHSMLENQQMRNLIGNRAAFRHEIVGSVLKEFFRVSGQKIIADELVTNFTRYVDLPEAIGLMPSDTAEHQTFEPEHAIEFLTKKLDF